MPPYRSVSETIRDETISESSSHHDPPPHVADHPDNDPAQLTSAVEFSELIAVSSLGTPEAREARLTGRKELNEYCAREAAAGRTPPPPFAGEGRDLDVEFELQVADRLELRDHAFEAELGYRRIQDMLFNRLRDAPAEQRAERLAVVAERLALMLDTKGFHRESWQLYARAARADHVNSLFRLATICWQQRSHGWATRLAKHAMQQLPREVSNALLASIHQLVERRRSDQYTELFLRRSLPLPGMDPDTIYALGSLLLSLASRPDLARLAYCSALIRGHSMAAVSLFDLTRAPRGIQPKSWRLKTLLRYELEEEKYAHYRPVEEGRDDFDNMLLLLKSSVQSDSFDTLLDTIGAYKVDHRASLSRSARRCAQVTLERRADALERVIYTTRLIVCLRGYAQLGYDLLALPKVDEAADRVCETVYDYLLAGSINDARSLINLIKEESKKQLDTCRRCAAPFSVALTAHHGRTCPSNAGDRWKERYEAVQERRYKEFAMGGTVARFGCEYVSLPVEQREVLILRLVGFDLEETAEVLGFPSRQASILFIETVERLQEAQRCEQMPTAEQFLWADVKSSFPDALLSLLAR